jgi:hypothetical protein
MNQMEKCRIRTKNDSAVSEAIGFTLIFSLVMIGIGLITLYGYPVLLETQSNANVRNMERDMIVLQNDMKSLVYKNTPYKETSLQVSGGALTVRRPPSPTTSKFTISNNSAMSDPFWDDYVGQLMYESDAGESIIGLENGAVFTRMEFQNGSAMLSEPRWFIDINTETGEKTFIITFIRINSDNPMSRIGMGVVKMQILPSLPPDVRDVTGDTIYIEYAPESSKYDFTKGWENYLNNSLGMDVENQPYTLTGIKTLVIRQYDVKIASL